MIAIEPIVINPSETMTSTNVKPCLCRIRT